MEYWSIGVLRRQMTSWAGRCLTAHSNFAVPMADLPPYPASRICNHRLWAGFPPPRTQLQFNSNAGLEAPPTKMSGMFQGLESEWSGFSKPWKVSRKIFQALEIFTGTFPRLGNTRPCFSQPWNSPRLFPSGAPPHYLAVLGSGALPREICHRLRAARQLRLLLQSKAEGRFPSCLKSKVEPLCCWGAHVRSTPKGGVSAVSRSNRCAAVSTRRVWCNAAPTPRCAHPSQEGIKKARSSGFPSAGGVVPPWRDRGGSVATARHTLVNFGFQEAWNCRTQVAVSFSTPVFQHSNTPSLHSSHSPAGISP